MDFLKNAVNQASQGGNNQNQQQHEAGSNQQGGGGQFGGAGNFLNSLGGNNNNQQGGQQGGSNQQQGGAGGFLGGLGDKLNGAAGGGRESEKNEDYLDKGVDFVQERVLGQGPQNDESAVEQAKDEQISDFIRGKYKETTGKEFFIKDKETATDRFTQ